MFYNQSEEEFTRTYFLKPLDRMYKASKRNLKMVGRNIAESGNFLDLRIPGGEEKVVHYFYLFSGV